MGVLLELFCGSKSCTKYAESIGMTCITVDINPKCKPTFEKDILTIDEEFLNNLVRQYGKITHIWCSPDCRHYSALRRNWKALKTKPPDLEYADKLVRKSLFIIEYLKPDLYWIENPYTGTLKNRGILDELPSKRVCYCQYDNGTGCFLTKKQTMIWGTVNDWQPRMCCRSSGYCEAKQLHGKHLQSLGNSNQNNPTTPRSQRGSVPPLLIQHLFDQCNTS